MMDGIVVRRSVSERRETALLGEAQHREITLLCICMGCWCCCNPISAGTAAAILRCILVNGDAYCLIWLNTRILPGLTQHRKSLRQGWESAEDKRNGFWITEGKNMGLFGKEDPCPICGEAVKGLVPTKVERQAIRKECSPSASSSGNKHIDAKWSEIRRFQTTFCFCV